jgi:hypothetical protein
MKTRENEKKFSELVSELIIDREFIKNMPEVIQEDEFNIDNEDF